MLLKNFDVDAFNDIIKTHKIFPIEATIILKHVKNAIVLIK